MIIKKLKPLDYIIIVAVIAVLLIGILVIKGKNKFSKSPVEATQKVAFQVLLRSVSVTDNIMPFRVGEESFITIRNVPYTKLQIIDSKFSPKKTMIPTGNAKRPYIVAEDISLPYQYDMIITLIDDAKITKDGAVVGGNKIKIGLPIVLEGFNYRIGGTISNVQLLDDKDVEIIGEFVKKQQKLNKIEAEKLKNSGKLQIIEQSKKK